MQASAIRHIAAAEQSSVVAAGFFEKQVQIWSWKTKRCLAEFESILDFGGRRLALTPDGATCIAGSFNRGVAAYSIPNGRILWHRRDIHGIQRITLSASGREIYCGVDQSSVSVVETQSGKSLEKINGASSVVASQFGPHRLLVRRGDGYLIRGDIEFEIPAVSFSLLAAAFSPDALCLSEPKTGIRCIDLVSGRLLWHHEGIGSNHLGFNSFDKKFYCVASSDTAADESALIRLAGNVLDCSRVLGLGRFWEGAFTTSGRVLVTAIGEVYETSTGTLLAHLDFPQRDYPDA